MNVRWALPVLVVVAASAVPTAGSVIASPSPRGPDSNTCQPDLRADQVVTNWQASTQVVVLDNDPETCSAPLPTVFSPPTHGRVSVQYDGRFVYSAEDGFLGTDSFTYQVTSALSGLSDVATVTLEVHAPVCVLRTQGDAYVVEGPLSVPAPGVFANDGETCDGFDSVNPEPAHGDLTFSLDGSFTYVPDDGYDGADSFGYIVGSAVDQSYVNVLVDLDVRCVRGQDDRYSVIRNRTFTAAAPGVLANDGVCGATPSLAAGPANGTVTLNADGSFVYEPRRGFRGTDTFTYELSRGGQVMDTAVVQLDVVNRGGR